MSNSLPNLPPHELKICHGICFDARNHSYTNLETKEVYLSGTGLIHKFHEPFNKVQVATDLCLNNLKYQGRNPKDVIKEWDKAAAKGTYIHNILENHLLGKEHAGHKAEGKAKERIDQLIQAWEGLDLLKDPKFELVPEVLVFLHQYKLAGQSDLVMYDHEAKTLRVYDYKTNKKIERSAYGGKTMFEPIEHLPDCNFIHYSLQLSLYSYFEEIRLGYKVLDPIILWVDVSSPDSVRIEPMQCKYHKEEIIRMLEFYYLVLDDGEIKNNVNN